jgi:hypothetical protein
LHKTIFEKISHRKGFGSHISPPIFFIRNISLCSEIRIPLLSAEYNGPETETGRFPADSFTKTNFSQAGNADK